jgi:hypothetical protein
MYGFARGQTKEKPEATAPTVPRPVRSIDDALLAATEPEQIDRLLDERIWAGGYEVVCRQVVLWSAGL